MQDQHYREQVMGRADTVDLDFWRRPVGVSVPDDELRFLLVPDAVEAAAIDDVAQQVHDYQQRAAATDEVIRRALIVTMGGMLPGVLLYDHLAEGRRPGTPPVSFGTIGVSLYSAPGVRYDQPRVDHGISIDLAGHTVLLIDDLIDLGGTMRFLFDRMAAEGALRALSLVLYQKPAARRSCPADFHFGEVDQDVWIITPRERVETLVKRVPVWKQRGADQAECRRRLVELIGYSQRLVDAYLPAVFAAA